MLIPQPCRRAFAIALTSAVGAILVPESATAQEVPASPARTGTIDIDGPPAPTAPDVIRRDEEGDATVRAVRVPEPLRIDGVLDDAFYGVSSPIPDFIQTVPENGAEPTQRTEAWIGFDESNVYVSARIWDTEPESQWVANEMRRDSPANRTNDNFGVFLDTFYDRRNAIGIYVNPTGGFSDMQITNEGNPNFDWNPVLDIRTGRFDGGWTVEMAIPFKSIRYRAGRDQVWGIQLRRSVIRDYEWSHLTRVPLAAAGDGSQAIFRVSTYGTLVGVEAPPPGRNIQIKPYAIAGLQTNLTRDPEVVDDGFADAGLDVKYAVTENLTADFTFNTDFAQVEVDEQQVNLTRFDLVFPEKRDFFLEGRGVYNFGAGGQNFAGGGGGGGGGGAAPSLFYSRRIGLHGGETVPILGGARFTGKVGDFDVGALSIQTDAVAAVGAESTNFSVLRLRRDVLRRSSIGMIFENRSRSLSGSGSNQAYGVDAAMAFFDNVSLLSYFAQTRTDGLTGNDQSYRARFGYEADFWGSSVDHLMVGDDFNPEIGIARRRGFRETALSARVSPRPQAIDWIRQLHLSGSVDYFENEQSGLVESRERGGRLQLDLESGDRATVGLGDSYESLTLPERISGATMPAGRYSFRQLDLNYNFGPQRRVSGSVSFSHGGYYSGEITSLGLNQGRIRVLPQFSLEPSLSLNWIDLPGLQSSEGQFNQHVSRLRANYSFSPRTFVSGLVQFNSFSNTFSTNARLRWEWAPGSELFIVYSEDRGAEPLGRWSDLDLSSRGLVIKVNRLFRL